MSSQFTSTLTRIKAQGMKVLVVGLGVTGLETARFLSAQGIRVVCTERSSEEKFNSRVTAALEVDALRSKGVEIQFGIDGELIQPILPGVALAVLSPGVPLESSIVGAIARVGIPYVSELELGIELHGGQCVLVTGSNGKSTTVSLIHHILRCSGIKSFLCGNVGVPVLASEELRPGAGSERSVLVVEASSYQLEACTVLKPKVSIILNISENHLERHGTLERYALAKASAIKLQGEGDTTILNRDDAVLKRLAESCKGEVIFFGRGAPSLLGGVSGKAVGFSVAENRGQRETTDEILAVVDPKSGELESYDVRSAHLIGEHNRYNMCAAIAACRVLGLPREQIHSALLSFVPLEHRLEVVGQEQGILAINDSKSTTVAAARSAFVTVHDHFPGRKIVLMIGGLSKAGSWDPLMKVVKQLDEDQVSVVCFGRDSGLLAGHCTASGINCVVSPTLQEAVPTAIQIARANGGVVLLSPGCASFDEFTDFEHRGAVFKAKVGEIFSSNLTSSEVAA